MLKGPDITFPTYAGSYGVGTVMAGDIKVGHIVEYGACGPDRWYKFYSKTEGIESDMNVEYLTDFRWRIAEALNKLNSPSSVASS